MFKNRSLRRKSNKSSGGQKGHKGSTFDKTNNPDFVVDLELCSCPHCKKKVSSEFPSNVTNPTQYAALKSIFDLCEIMLPVVE